MNYLISKVTPALSSFLVQLIHLISNLVHLLLQLTQLGAVGRIHHEIGKGIHIQHVLNKLTTMDHRPPRENKSQKS